MEPDFYKVQILHYLNPHLIWVEVLNGDDNYVFEQVGIYGLLPLNCTIDINLTLQTQKSEEWMPAAVMLMKNFLFEAEEVWFQATYIDRRSSIFDDNIHKFGEILIKKSNGKEKCLSTFLAQSGFALRDEALFHQELSSGNVKSKLDRLKTRDVIKQLTSFYEEKENAKFYEKSFKQQTTVLHKSNELESILTVQNLDRHNREYCDKILHNKLKDLDLCKGIDEMSLGRASSSKKLPKRTRSKILERKMILKKKKDQIELDIFQATKKFLEDKCKDNLGEFVGCNSSDLNDSQYHSLFPSKQQIPTSNSVEETSTPDTKKHVSSTNHNDSAFSAQSEKLSGKGKSKSPKISEYDLNNEKRMAYGPPDVDKRKLIVKKVPKTDVDEFDMPGAVATQNDKVDEEIPKSNTFDDADSDTLLEISNLDVLKKMKDNQPAVITTLSGATLKFDSDVGKQKKGDKPNISPKLAEIETVTGFTETDGSVKNIDANDNNCDKNNTVTKSNRKGLLLERYRNVNRHDISTSISDTTNKDTSSEGNFKVEDDIDTDDESISGIIDQVNANSNYISPKKVENPTNITVFAHLKANVNPFKNLEKSKSVFVEKLVSPVLMVHTKKNNRIQPACTLRDLPFGSNIQVALKNMHVNKPTRIQTVSWPTILRGHSVFIISPMNSGKTMGYLPAVCRLVTDISMKCISGGPSCIIVCATAISVSEVERLARMFLGLNEKVLALYSGMDELSITTSLLNGCDVLICTAPMLVRLLQTEFGVDLKRLAAFVLDDCERLSVVYTKEIKICIYKIKEMLKNRANKELKVQFVISSRIWCNFMESLALKTPDTVICIGSFQECVLYSKANTTVKFVMKENKLNNVVEFLKSIDGSKKTVIVCRDDDEVELLDKTLTGLKYVVYACNGTMTLHDLYNLSVAVSDYREPLLGPILVCCDGNLTHLNVTDAHYLIHYSMPLLFSQFCKRFSVLNDNYASIFKTENENVKINILIEESNLEQLPKILHFVSRCSYNVPEKLSHLCKVILAQKDLIKAKKLVPICNNLLTLGECPNVWNCEERHSIIREFDNPRDKMPKRGIVTFKILHYHNAVTYSAKLLSNIVDGEVRKYPQPYSALSLQMGMYYSNASNLRLHGVPKVGDICAVSLKLNFHARCQVLKILNYYPRGNPNYVLINLLDEQKLEKTRDIYLFHLPDELKKIDSYVVNVRLANIQPQDKDITYTDLAKDLLKRVTDNDDELYARGKIVMTVGNCIFVDTLEACQHLSSINETVVKHNFKKDLMDGHAIPKADHIKILKVKCQDLDIEQDEVSSEHELVDLVSSEDSNGKGTQNKVNENITNAVERINETENWNKTVSFQKDSANADSRAKVGKVKNITVRLEDLNSDAKGTQFVRNKEVIIDQESSDSDDDDDDLNSSYTNSIGGNTDDKIDGNMSDVDSLSNEGEFIQKTVSIESSSIEKETVEYEHENVIVETCTDDIVERNTIDEIKKQQYNKTNGDEVNAEKIPEKKSDSIKNAKICNNTSTAVSKCKKLCRTNSYTVPTSEPLWAHLDSEDFCEVFFSSAESPSKFFVRLSKFEQCITYLLDDIKQYVKANPSPVISVQIGDIVLAKFPDDSTFERARIDEIINGKVKCFFVDQGEWRDVSVKDLVPIPEYLLKKLPFQVIECRLLGVKPVSTEWTEFCTNWFCDKCLEDEMKYLYLQYLTKETAECTGGYKYGVIIVDTNSDKDIILNKLIVEANFADENHEMELVDSASAKLNALRAERTLDDTDVEETSNSLVPRNQIPSDSMMLRQPLRSIPLFDNSLSDDEWSVNLSDDEIMESVKPYCQSLDQNIHNSIKELPGPKLEKATIKEIFSESGTHEIVDKKDSKDDIKSQDIIAKVKDEPRNNIEEKEFKIEHVMMLRPVDELSKPKLVWRQTKLTVTIKIHLIGAEDYNLIIKERCLDFSATLNDVKYGFKLDLYGVVDTEKCKHGCKGLHILVNLVKILQSNWLTLTQDDEPKKWIVYDVESIEVSSDEETEPDKSILNLIEKKHNAESESDDDDFHDDFTAGYAL